jgi:dehydrogenase/reductase SDR family protein 7B
MNFHGQVVWITGASSGIGAALAQAFAREGAELVLSARREDALAEVGERWPLPLDLADPPALSGKAQAVLDRFGRVDWLVHNAGVSQRARAIDTAIAVDETILRTNFLGPVALTKAVLPSMVLARRGGFVVVSSLVGKFGTPLRSTYAASKHALHGFFDSLRAEHWQDNLQVTIACPGFVATEVSRHALAGDGQPHGAMDEKTARGVSPERCAGAILDAVAKRREEVNIGGAEIAGVYLKRFAPTLFSRYVRRAKVT